MQREYKRHHGELDFTSRARREHKAAVDDSRYRIIAQKRALELEGLDIPRDNAAFANGELNNRRVEKEEVKQESSGQKRKDIDQDGEGANAEDKENADPAPAADVDDKIFLLYDVDAPNESSDNQTKKQKVTLLYCYCLLFL